MGLAATARADGPQSDAAPPASGSASSSSLPPTSRAPAFHPTPDLDLPKLEDLVRRRSADVEAANLEVDLAEAGRRQAGLPGNPTFDFTWGTIPVGTSNPATLQNPIAHVPNYNFGLSYTIPIGKISPRVDMADAELRGAKADRDATSRAEALQLAQVLGMLATSQLRSESLRELLGDAHREVDVAESKLKSGFGIPLDVDRLRVEQSRAEQQMLSAESDRDEALASCAALVGATCEPFSNADEARLFLEHWIDRVPKGAIRYEDRPDLRALSAYQEAAEHEGTLARNTALPDPTVRFGYTHDTFVVSGNQADSLSITVAVPLNFVDRGQAQAQAADAKRSRYGSQRARLLMATEARVPALVDRLDAQRKRQDKLTTDALPHALSVLKDVQRTETAQLVPITELIQARRAVSELVLEQADSYSDAFSAALELASVLPPSTPLAVVPRAEPPPVPRDTPAAPAQPSPTAPPASPTH
jgi:cobalt-zinc-cadmium efflux system outer membrane protein